MPKFETIIGATPIEDASDLIPTHILTRPELNEWESQNILNAVRKYLGKRKQHKFDITFVKSVHKDMFDDTWKWAGEIRKRNFNIGADWHKIQEELKALADDIAFWQNQKDGLGLLEQSVRIHHRIVKIHPFVNGNGRHARLVADIFLFSNEHKLPNWPNNELVEETDIRKRYIDALKSADKGNYEPLEKFTSKLID
ncbi:MAG: mobile mystery protein B [Candidatus Saganbacteria bacterium]|nr:mobile mystery protein B [Candidatus Saganbacteria bacterium]